MLTTVLRILFQSPPDHSIEFRWNLLIEISQGQLCLVQNTIIDGSVAVSFERAMARSHLIKHHAQAENIGSYVDRLPKCLFRRHIIYRADYSPGIRHLRTARRA